MLIFSLLNLYEWHSLKKTMFKSVRVSLVLSAVFLSLGTIVIFSVVMYYCANTEKITDAAFLGKVGTFTEGAKRRKPSDTKTALVIPLMYFMRSFVLGVGLVYL